MSQGVSQGCVKDDSRVFLSYMMGVSTLMQPGSHTGFVQDVSKTVVLMFLQFFGKLNQFLNFGSESSSTKTEQTRLITMR